MASRRKAIFSTHCTICWRGMITHGAREKSVPALIRDMVVKAAQQQ